MTHPQDFKRWMPGWAVTSTHGKWIVAYEMATKQGDAPGESILFLKQVPRIWHAFYRERATGSATTPASALTGSLGDVISTDSELHQYCKLVLGAPRELVSQFGGLDAAQSQCHDEMNSSR